MSFLCGKDSARLRCVSTREGSDVAHGAIVKRKYKCPACDFILWTLEITTNYRALGVHAAGDPRKNAGVEKTLYECRQADGSWTPISCREAGLTNKSQRDLLRQPGATITTTAGLVIRRK